MKIPLKAIFIIFLIAFFSSAGVFLLLLAKNKEANMRDIAESDMPAILLSPTFDPSKLEVIADAPSFSYIDALGNTFTSEALQGKIWLADFFFTSCPGICPTMMENTAKLAEEFKDEAVHFVCFSVDPETDTPDRMKAYGEKYGADPNKWHLLTGPFESTVQLSLEGFKVGKLDSPMDHSARMALVDYNGKIRGYFSAIDDEDQKNLILAVRQLLKEM